MKGTMIQIEVDGSGSSGKGEDWSKRLLGGVGIDDVKDIKEVIR